MTAAAIVARRRVDPRANLKASAALVRAAPPVWEGRKLNFVYWHYGTQASALLGGQDWRAWHAALVRALVPNQRHGGGEAGSWDPVDEWGLAGGRAYATALNALTLTIAPD